MKREPASADGQDLAPAVDPVREAVRSGRSLICFFDRAEGSTRLEVLGPKGMIGCADEFLTAPVPTLRLWSPQASNQPIATAAANKGFPDALEVLARRARPLVGDELPFLLAILSAVREETARMRFRVPSVGEMVTANGRPTLAAWGAALTLGDMQSAVLKAVA